MPLLISSPTYPSNDIDVYLRPFIDEYELNELWTSGINTYNAHTGTAFCMHEALLWATVIFLHMQCCLLGKQKN